MHGVRFLHNLVAIFQVSGFISVFRIQENPQCTLGPNKNAFGGELKKFYQPRAYGNISSNALLDVKMHGEVASESGSKFPKSSKIEIVLKRCSCPHSFLQPKGYQMDPHGQQTTNMKIYF